MKKILIAVCVLLITSCVKDGVQKSIEGEGLELESRKIKQTIK